MPPLSELGYRFEPHGTILWTAVPRGTVTMTEVYRVQGEVYPGWCRTGVPGGVLYRYPARTPSQDHI